MASPFDVAWAILKADPLARLYAPTPENNTMSASQTIHPAAIGAARRAAGPFAVSMPEITKPFADDETPPLSPPYFARNPNLPSNFDTQTDTRMLHSSTGVHPIATSRAPTFIPPNAKRHFGPDYPNHYEKETPHEALIAALRRQNNPYGEFGPSSAQMTPEEIATGEPAVRAFDEIPDPYRDDFVRGNERAQAFRDRLAEHRQMMNQ